MSEEERARWYEEHEGKRWHESIPIEQHGLLNYELQLGSFISLYAGIQVNLFAFLGVVAGLPIAGAQALFAGISVQNSIDKIKKVMSVKNFPKQDIEEVNRCLIQMRAINEARNDIIHYGIEEDCPNSHLGKSEFIVSNRFSALTPDKITRFVVSGSIIRSMTEDIGQILFIFSILSMRYQGTPLNATVDEVKEEWRWKRRNVPP